MKKNPPCGEKNGDCPDRWVSESDRCHVHCERFARWQAEIAADNAARKAERKEQADVKMSHRCKSSRQRR